ncbi:hypothetical protein P691DRAFT_707730 [Macrolepiota fuliginosa MF-IS2]|uniref:vesicle-fusing ATPase n=1 Tax=Macrolepiota fuliginosa MF-IS2 TaxID=1400762 RepID=A0A9P5XCN0_9AGAR|nr:hypothetical protein P691DRAFT_707730 [Macrolepiota fuliginosa MF-IS2]
MLALKYEKNSDSRTKIQTKINEYLTRAEVLKDHLSNPSKPQEQEPGSTIAAPTNFLDRGIEIVKRAIDEDQKQNYAEAFTLYQNALDYLGQALKFEKNEQVKPRIKAKINEYLTRAEALKAFLQSHSSAKRDGSTPAPTVSGSDHLARAIEVVKEAVENDQKQNYSEAYELYRNSIDRFMLALKYEKNEQNKEGIRKKITEYTTRAEQLKAYLKDSPGGIPAQ